MTHRQSHRLRLESLENREVPAAFASFSGGNLTIIGDNTGNNLALVQQAGGQIKVTNNAANLGTFAVTGNINVTMGNGADTVSVTTAAGKSLPGNLTVNAGNGDDLVDLNGDFLGNVNVFTGLGNDNVTSSTADVSVSGSLFFADPAGINVIDLNDRNFTVGGSLYASGVSAFDMGTGNTLSVGGNTYLAATTAFGSKLNAQFNGAAVNLSGSTLISGGSGNDVVIVTAVLNAGGNFNVNANAGDNTFVLTPAAGGAVGGSLSYTGGAGVDVAVFGSDSVVAGRTSISVGNGINTFVDTPTSLYAGTLAIAGGNGTHTNVVTGQVAGNLEVTLGNGNGHTTVITGSVGGATRYRGGNGQLGVLTVAPAAAATINADWYFGAGSFTLTLGPNVTLNGLVRGTPGGLYTFNQGTALLGNITFINFP